MSALALSIAPQSQAQINLLATGTLDQTRAGSFADLSGLNYTLENGVKATELGGFGSAIAYVGGNIFLALPDRGPNAVTFDPAIDNTASYVTAAQADSHVACHHPFLELDSARLRHR